MVEQGPLSLRNAQTHQPLAPTFALCTQSGEAVPDCDPECDLDGGSGPAFDIFLCYCTADTGRAGDRSAPLLKHALALSGYSVFLGEDQLKALTRSRSHLLALGRSLSPSLSPVPLCCGGPHARHCSVPPCCFLCATEPPLPQLTFAHVLPRPLNGPGWPLGRCCPVCPQAHEGGACTVQ